MWGAMGARPLLPMAATQPEENLEATFELEAPFYIEPIIAWRAWNVCAPGVCDCFEKTGRGRALVRSITHPIPWLRKRATRAHCIHRWKRSVGVKEASQHHSAPDQTHGCGIYAVKSVKTAVDWSGFYRTKFSVVGEVQLWGQVLQYQDGFIAEYAYPLSFYVPDNYDFYVKEDGTAEGGKPMIDPREIAYMIEDAYGVESYLGLEGIEG